MDVIDVMDAIAAHAVAAAAAVDATFVDVAVGFVAGKGKSIRVYYGGEIGPQRMGSDKVLDADMIGERVIVNALWPIASSGKAEGRSILGDMWSLKHELRTRLRGDSQLGGDTFDMKIPPATVTELILGGHRGTGQHYLQLEMEVDLDYSEYAIAV